MMSMRGIALWCAALAVFAACGGQARDDSEKIGDGPPGGGGSGGSSGVAGARAVNGGAETGGVAPGAGSPPGNGGLAGGRVGPVDASVGCTSLELPTPCDDYTLC